MFVRAVASLRTMALKEGLAYRSVWVKAEPVLTAKEFVKRKIPPGLASFYVYL